jgi:hypothetical protein
LPGLLLVLTDFNTAVQPADYSLIESYWKSAAVPDQGIFIGEPLAKPFAYK